MTQNPNCALEPGSRVALWLAPVNVTVPVLPLAIYSQFCISVPSISIGTCQVSGVSPWLVTSYVWQ